MALKIYYDLLHKYLRPQGVRIGGFTALLLLATALQLINPQIIRYFLDAAQSEADHSALVYATLLFITFGITHQVAALFASYIGENIGWTATNWLREDIAGHCLRLDMTFHDQQTSGSLVERIDGDVSALTRVLSTFFITLFSNFLLIVGIITMLARESYVIALAITCCLIFSYFTVYKIRNMAAHFWEKTMAIAADLFGFIGEYCSKNESIKANNAADYAMSQFYLLIDKLYPVRNKAFLSFGFIWGVTIVLMTLVNVMAIVISTYIWSKEAITVGTIYMIFFYTDILIRPIDTIKNEIDDLQRADSGIKRINQLFSTSTKIGSGAGAGKTSGNDIRFDHVSFSYDKKNNTIEDFSLDIQSGTVLGIVGKTGSGKTTLAKLLLRFYDPGKGRITINSTDIKSFTLDELYRKVGYVSQNVQIFNASVRNNIAFFSDTVDDKKIIQIIKKVGLGDWLNAQKQGLDTPLHSSGSALSVGQAQLLAFARVLMTDPDIIILDEASAHLDAITEQRIIKLIEEIFAKKTCIVIAHRLETLKKCDKVLLLENGNHTEFCDKTLIQHNIESILEQVMATNYKELLV